MTVILTQPKETLDLRGDLSHYTAVGNSPFFYGR